MRETPNQRRIWLAACSLAGTILFRVNTGQGWVPGAGKPRHVDGAVVLPGGRPIALGFGDVKGKPVSGVGDLNGWRSILVTPDMVGCRVAVFLSVEAKRTDGGVISEDQKHWRDTVLAAGGIAVVASSPEEAVSLIRAWRPPRPAA